MSFEEKQEQEGLKSAKENENKAKKKQKGKNKKASIKQWIKKVVIAFAIKAGIILGGMIIVSAIIASALDLLADFVGDVIGMPAHVVENVMDGTQLIKGDNSGYWFPIAKSDIPAEIFDANGGLPEKENGGIVTSEFGPRNLLGMNYHYGIDMAFANISGKKVIATKDGKASIYKDGVKRRIWKLYLHRSWKWYSV